MNIYEGDPKMVLGPDGSKLVYKGGQPVMDQGVENLMLIRLFTRKKGLNSHKNGWVGNYLIRDPAQRIGSDYQERVENQPITLGGLAVNEQAAIAALKDKALGDVVSVATNPSLDNVTNKMRVNSPAGAFDFRTDTFSGLWQAQAENPANERI